MSLDNGAELRESSKGNEPKTDRLTGTIHQVLERLSSERAGAVAPTSRRYATEEPFCSCGFCSRPIKSCPHEPPTSARLDARAHSCRGWVYIRTAAVGTMGMVMAMMVMTMVLHGDRRGQDGGLHSNLVAG